MKVLLEAAMGGGRGGGGAAGAPDPPPSAAAPAAARTAASPGPSAVIHAGGRRGRISTLSSTELLFSQDLCRRTGLRLAACLAATDALIIAAAEALQ